MPRWWASESYSSDYTVGAGPVSLPDLLKRDLLFWIQGDSIDGDDGDAVSLWQDLSGNGYDFRQTTTADKPTLKVDGSGFKYVYFDGDDHLQRDGLVFPSGSGTYTIAASYRIAEATLSHNHCLFGSGNYNTTNQAYMLRVEDSSPDKHRDSWWANNLDLGAGVSPQNWTKVLSRFDGGGRDMWATDFSGSPDTSDSQTNKNTQVGVGGGQEGSLLGAAGTGGSGLQHQLDGSIRELLIWETALSDELVENVGEYLTDRYG